MKIKKTETIAEYLARGGSITKLAPGETAKQIDVTRTTNVGGPAVILSLEDADLFYGEARKNSKPKKAKAEPTIDINALPEALRTKYLNRLKEETNGEGSKESFQEDSEECESED